MTLVCFEMYFILYSLEHLPGKILVNFPTQIYCLTFSHYSHSHLKIASFHGKPSLITLCKPNSAANLISSLTIIII